MASSSSNSVPWIKAFGEHGPLRYESEAPTDRTLTLLHRPDGIYVPPNRDAMVYDLQTLKKLGFNMLRKHVRSKSRVWLEQLD